jgi:protein TonB
MRLFSVIILFVFGLALPCIAQNTDPKMGKIKVRKYDEQKFYVEVDEVPRYVNGPNALLDDIQKGIIYPEAALEQKVAGTVMVKVIIDKHGKVTNTSIHSSPNSILNKAAMVSAKSLQKFEPHLEKGFTVACQFILPIKFFLPV